MIIGFDEAGRGCWAGPLVVGAVRADTILGVNDSKTLSAKKRELLFLRVLQECDYGIGWVWPAEVDTFGLTRATTLAAMRALRQLSSRLPEDRLIFDGSYDYLPDELYSETLINGDALVPAISAASILAKVSRDHYMHALSKLYPQFGFDSHVGYGTATHSAALKLHAPSAIHRLSYKPVQRALRLHQNQKGTA